MYFLFGFDLRAYAIKVLSGYSRLLLDGLADSFYHQVLISKENKIVFEVFNDMKTKGRVVLASASLDVVVSVIAKNNNVEYVSSILEFESGVCSGLLNKDLLGNKYVAIKKLVGAPSFYSMYSDNKEDLQMKNYFDHYFYVQNIFLSKLSRIIRFQ